MSRIACRAHRNGGQFARMARFVDKSAPEQCFAHSAALGAFVADHTQWDGIVIFAGPVTTWLMSARVS